MNPFTTQDRRIDLQRLIAFLRKRYKPLWQRLNTKRYEEPGFHSNEVVAASLGLAVILAEENWESYYEGSTFFNVMASARVLYDYDYPTFFVDKHLVSALLRTDPPTELTWADLELPFPGMIFMLPTGAAEGKDGPVPFLGVCKLQAEKLHHFPGFTRKFVSEKQDGICVFWAHTPARGDLVLGNVVTPATDHFKVDPLSLRQRSEELKEMFGIKNEGLQLDSEFASAMISLAAKFILVMHARPQIIESGHYIRKSLKRGGIQVWSPNFIGRNYTYTKTPEGETVPLDKTGKAAEIRFRRGHYRRQPFGPGKRDHKTIWIEPFFTTVWVNVASNATAA